MLIGVTGADGFVGRHVGRALKSRGLESRPLVRDPVCAKRVMASAPDSLPPVVVGDLGPDTDWTRALGDAEVVIHLAARVHIMDERAADPLAAFRHVNVLGTRQLAESAAACGVRRLIFVSSIKVNGESTTGRAPFSELDPPDPCDAYGRSKWEAELALAEVSAATGIETVVIRPPLVHGAGVGGNRLRLMKFIDRGVPLPFAGVHNRRTLIAAENLAAALTLAVDHAAAAGRTFMVGDDEDVSTEEMVRILAAGLGRPARLLPAPLGALQAAATLMGRGAAFDRLTGSLQVDSAAIRGALGWEPPLSAAAGLAGMAAWYRTSR